MLHQIKYPKPITGFTFSQDMSHLAVGMIDGTISIGKNKEREKITEKLDEAAFLMNEPTNESARSYKYFFRGIYEKKPKGQDGVTVLEAVNSTRKLAQFDKYLK